MRDGISAAESRSNDGSSKTVLDYEQALVKVGGFGRAQVYVSVVIILSFATKGWIVYGLTFLMKYPEYLCLEGGKDEGGEGSWRECKR